jgi:hypothetical protein
MKARGYFIQPTFQKVTRVRGSLSCLFWAQTGFYDNGLKSVENFGRNESVAENVLAAEIIRILSGGLEGYVPKTVRMHFTSAIKIETSVLLRFNQKKNI